MNSRDREEARIMFQLVCFAKIYDVKSINLRQLKEAVTISQNNSAESAHRDSVGGLGSFRRRMRAQSGGLLEESLYETDFEAYSSGEMDLTPVGASGQRAHNHYKKHGGMIKLIHRTAESYLDSEGWLLGLKSLQLTSPHALWLHVCCKSIQSKFGRQELLLRHAKPEMLKADESTQYSLFRYASFNLFLHARLLEFGYQESSLPFLATVSPMLWRYLRSQYRSRFYSRYGGFKAISNWDAVDEGSDRQPCQIIVEQGLPLCLRDAALKRYYTPPSDGEDISLALSDAMRFEKCNQFQLISRLVNLGAIVHQKHIINCIHRCRDDILGFLLTSWPKGNIRWRRDSLYEPGLLGAWRTDEDKENDTYNGESSGILWELVRVKYHRQKHYKAMLILLLERRESLNDVCGPGGTALHGSIIGLNKDVVKMILDNGANPNVSGPRGTPLQLAWRTFRSKPNYWALHRNIRLALQDVMSLLLNYGADPSWVEPNGIAIDRRIIETWCVMSVEEMEARWDDDDYPYCESNWYTYEFPLYRYAQKLWPEKYIESYRKTYLQRSVTPCETQTETHSLGNLFLDSW